MSVGDGLPSKITRTETKTINGVSKTVIYDFKRPPGWPENIVVTRPDFAEHPDPAWPPAPAGWVFWVPRDGGPPLAEFEQIPDLLPGSRSWNAAQTTVTKSSYSWSGPIGSEPPPEIKAMQAAYAEAEQRSRGRFSRTTLSYKGNPVPWWKGALIVGGVILLVVLGLICTATRPYPYY